MRLPEGGEEGGREGEEREGKGKKAKVREGEEGGGRVHRVLLRGENNG